MTPFAENLRQWNRDCTGREPSMSLLQRGADEAADLIDMMALVLASCGELFGDIRDDYTDPRRECLAGMAMATEALAMLDKAVADD